LTAHTKKILYFLHLSRVIFCLNSPLRYLNSSYISNSYITLVDFMCVLHTQHNNYNKTRIKSPIFRIMGSWKMQKKKFWNLSRSSDVDDNNDYGNKQLLVLLFHLQKIFFLLIYTMYLKYNRKKVKNFNSLFSP
jgi:hypothetical protein